MLAEIDTYNSIAEWRAAHEDMPEDEITQAIEDELAADAAIVAEARYDLDNTLSIHHIGYHEEGHALVGDYASDAETVHKDTKRVGNRGGVTVTRFHTSSPERLAELQFATAQGSWISEGRFGIDHAGTASDQAQISALEQNITYLWGPSKAAAIKAKGFQLAENAVYSVSMREIVDRGIKTTGVDVPIEAAFERKKRILKNAA